MIIVLGAVFIFFAIFLFVYGLAWRPESQMSARLAGLRGERDEFDMRAAVQRSDSMGSRLLLPLADSLGARLEQLLPTKMLDGIRLKLTQAGEPVTLTGFLVASAVVEATMLLLGFTMISSGGIGAGSAPFVMLVLGGFGLLGPRVWLSNRARHRQKEILKSLPDAFDLITVCVEAGLGLEAAISKVAEKTQGAFGEELGITMREISLGKLRREALRELANRTGVPDLTAFINAVIQAESMGTSIATVLRVQADQMRMRRRQRAEQQAHAAPIKMMFPLVLFIFPSLFIVILGPAGISIYETLVAK